LKDLKWYHDGEYWYANGIWRYDGEKWWYDWDGEIEP